MCYVDEETKERLTLRHAVFSEADEHGIRDLLEVIVGGVKYGRGGGTSVTTMYSQAALLRRCRHCNAKADKNESLPCANRLKRNGRNRMENREAIEYINWMRDKFITNKPLEAIDLAISALEKQEQDRWRPCNEKPEYDFRNVLVRWHDKRKGCEKDYYVFEGYVVRGIWCGMFEDADISDFEPIEWKPLEPYMEE